MKSTTVAEFQSMTDTDPDEIQTANPFAGLRIDVQADDEWGMAMHKVRTALLDAGRVASEEQIRAETSRLWGPAADTTTATIARNGKVDFVDMDSPEGQAIVEGVVRSAMGLPAELPGMPERPAPKQVMRVPSESEFGADGEEFFISSPLRARADVLIDRHPDLFEHLYNLSVTYLWRRKGGKTRGVPSLGKTIKPSGLLKMFSESDFAIVLAADNCRAYGYQDREIEALLFHHMLRTGLADVDEETGRGGGPTLVAPDVELFGAEVEVYGLWRSDLREVAPMFRQAELFGGANDPAEASLPVAEAAGNGDGAGVLIWPDGTDMTTEEIADMEAREAQDL